jgi:hypothetical protein
LRKADLRTRVKGNVEFRVEKRGLTSYAGLELVRRYLSVIRFGDLIRGELGNHVPPTDFGVVSMVMVVLALVISGGRRLRQLLYLEGDPLVLRLCGLTRLPTPRSVGRWLREFRAHHLPRLQRLNAQIVAAVIRRTGLRRLTIDVDGTVVSTGQRVQWAQRGYNPHRRKVPSYYPITAYEAQSGQILRVQNRPGDIHDGKAARPFLRALLAQLDCTLGSGYLLEFRMDGAFFLRQVIELLVRRGVEYAIKVPFWPFLGLKQKVEQTQTWRRIDEEVSFAEHRLAVTKWGMEFRLLIYRTRVHHETAKNFQLDLFDPADGHYEYSAIATNKTLGGKALWAFMCGRGIHEKVYGELKSGFAFDSVPTMRYAANSAWQLFSVLAFNLMHGFQIATDAVRRSATSKRRALYRFATIHTLRYHVLHRAGVLLRPAGHPIIDIGPSPTVAERFKTLHRTLRTFEAA